MYIVWLQMPLKQGLNVIRWHVIGIDPDNDASPILIRKIHVSGKYSWPNRFFHTIQHWLMGLGKRNSFYVSTVFKKLYYDLCWLRVVHIKRWKLKGSKCFWVKKQMGPFHIHPDYVYIYSSKILNLFTGFQVLDMCNVCVLCVTFCVVRTIKYRVFHVFVFLFAWFLKCDTNLLKSLFIWFSKYMDLLVLYLFMQLNCSQMYLKKEDSSG